MHRRTFLLTSLLPALLASTAEATEIDPKQTFVLQRDGIKFAPWAGLPPGSGEMAALARLLNEMIDRLEKSEVKLRRFATYEPLFEWPLLAALGFLTLEIILANTRFRRVP